MLPKLARALILGMTAYAGPAGAEDLAGTTWELLEIRGMDGTLSTPTTEARYSIAFSADGSVALQADCNRGIGFWTSSAEGNLTFGLIAATRALCSPGSLSETYLEQFEWVRTYTIENYHLFLATMADGSILEFAPAPADTASAWVLGETLGLMDVDQLRDTILSRLLDQYSTERGITVEPSEVEALLGALRAAAFEEGAPAEESRQRADPEAVRSLEVAFATSLVRQWKINSALFEEFGGRVSYQQLVPEPVDALRSFLEKRRDTGAFRLSDADLVKPFWDYYTNDDLHDFMNSESRQDAFANPPWERLQ
ncbi:META domain-containing protein [Salipiger sp.]|uniref:META domain-containing protein n=1 Tax=Salipiger sp. TaxID=2078585 RepID=UPI003A977504